MRDSLPEEMRYYLNENGDMALNIGQSGRFWNANVSYVAKNAEIAPGIKLIATRSPYLGYCSSYPSVNELAVVEQHDHQTLDDIKVVGMPEISLSLETASGEVLVVGCSHSSVQLIVQEAKAYTNNGIALLYGGYHMLPYDRREVTTVAGQLKNLGVQRVAPAHCTGHLAFKVLKDTYGADYIFAGLGGSTKF